MSEESPITEQPVACSAEPPTSYRTFFKEQLKVRGPVCVAATVPSIVTAACCWPHLTPALMLTIPGILCQMGDCLNDSQEIQSAHYQYRIKRSQDAAKKLKQE